MLVVGLAEPEIQPWIRAAGHAVRAVRNVADALQALEEDHADLVIVDREPAGLDVPGVCRALRADERLEEAWLLALTIAAHKRTADAALDAGADDYLHRPFTRAELLARARAGLRAAQQRADDALVRALMVNVPGAIYRSAWHADFTLELISDEIERISGYPAANFIASKKRTLWSIVHPDDRPNIQTALNQASSDGEPFGFEYRIIRADGEIRWVLDRGQLVSGSGGRLWCDGAIFDVTERRAAEEAARAREIEQRPQRGAARVAPADRRGRRQRSPQDRARPPRRRPAAARRARTRGADGAVARGQGPVLRGAVPGAGRARADRGLRRPARAGARHPPRRADRARPGSRDRGAGVACSGAGRRGRACPRTGSRR